MLSLTSEYALRAVVHLAQQIKEWPIPGRRIAAELGIPSKYLSHILGELVRGGVLRSTRGKHGGFELVDSPRNIRLYQVLAPFESLLGRERPCPFGRAQCSDDDPCAGHHRWKRVREEFSRFLMDTSVQDVSSVRNGRRKPAGAKRTRR